MYICNTYRTRLTSMNTRDIHTKPDGLNTHSHEDHLKNSKACTKALKHNLNANTRSSEQIHTKRTQTNVLQMDGQTCHGISHGIEVCMSLSCAILIGQDWMCGCSNYRANVFHERTDVSNQNNKRRHNIYIYVYIHSEYAWVNWCRREQEKAHHPLRLLPAAKVY